MLITSTPSLRRSRATKTSMMFESRSTCCGAPSLQDRDPVETGQTQVEDDGVAGFGVAEEMPFLASGPEIDCSLSFFISPRSPLIRGFLPSQKP